MEMGRGEAPTRGRPDFPAWAGLAATTRRSAPKPAVGRGWADTLSFWGGPFPGWLWVIGAAGGGESLVLPHLDPLPKAHGTPAL